MCSCEGKDVGVGVGMGKSVDVQLVPRNARPPTCLPANSPLSACPVLTKLGPRLLSTERSCCARCGEFASKRLDATSASTMVMKLPRLAATRTDRAASSAWVGAGAGQQKHRPT